MGVQERTAIRWVAWQRRLGPYLAKDKRRLWFDLITAAAGYALTLSVMVWMIQHDVTYALVLGLSIVAAGLLVRLFIFFHDACHRACFALPAANAVLGYILGVMVFTPYHAWRTQHLHHHTTVADLDHRGAGDVWTMTVDEYKAAPKLTRVAYYVFRQPWFLFTVASVFNFCVLQRLPSRKAGRLQNVSVLVTDLALVALAILASVTIGWRAYVAVQLPVIAVAASAGTWLFYVQHQFQGVYWAREGDWDPVRAALEGSSYYRLPRLMQWVTGNIGFHHVHHLSPRMPYYQLERAHHDVAELGAVKSLTLGDSLRCARLNLWDESLGRLVSFAEARCAVSSG